MAKLIVLRGISGSGKSTWTAAYKANHPDEKVLVVNRDSIRALCFGSEEAHGVDEGLVTEIQNTMVRRASRDNYTIILDNTNIEPEFITATIKQTPPATEIEVIMMPVDLERALLLNDARGGNWGRRVPEHVIRKQYARLLETKDWTP